MDIFIASDHGGYELKEYIFNKLKWNPKYHLNDLGCYSTKSCDYPICAKNLCQHVNKLDNSKGILICTTGQGMCMTANSQPNIRAALIYNKETAKLAREHNNANVLCLGSKFVNNEDAMEYIDIFLNTSFSNEPRHILRVEQIKN